MSDHPDSPGAATLTQDKSPFDALEGERRVLVDLVWSNARRLEGDDNQKAIRKAFVHDRYAREMKDWRRRRDLYRAIYVAVAFGTGALGVVSTGLVAATSNGRSETTNVVLILIGVLVAIFAATNQFLSPRQLAVEYKRDELSLRMLGWRYLQQIEEGVDPRDAYMSFQRDVSDVLKAEHAGAFGAQAS